MTASDAHGISPGFEWKHEYQTTLESIADTDEVDPDLDWPPLKDAIKYKIQAALSAFSPNPPATLHRAAALIPLIQKSMEEAGLVGETSYSTSSSADSLASCPSGSLASAASPNAAGQAAASAQANRFAPEGAQDAAMEEEPDVSPADAQGFFPSKSQPSAEMGASWGRRLTEQELESQLALVFGMLDEFDTQPPFTVQRLAELAVRPMEFHQTRAKYLHALQRVLSVTATRDAFPVSPASDGVALETMSLPTDGAIPALGAVDEGGGFANGAVGCGSVRRRSLSSASQAAVERHMEPLFSPIPFLVRDAGQEEGEAAAQAAGEKSLEEVPEMELGGANGTRGAATQEKAETPGPTSLGNDGHGDAGPVDKGEADQQDGAAPDAARARTHATPLRAGATDEASRPAGSVGATPASGGARTTPRVPKGRIDELDQTTSPAPADGTEGHGSRNMQATPTPLSCTTKMVDQPRCTAQPAELEVTDEKEHEARRTKRPRAQGGTASQESNQMDVDPNVDPGVGFSEKHGTHKKQEE